MADKNITMRQKDDSGVYNKLYPKTTATQSKLSAETAELFGDGVTDVDAAIKIVASRIKLIGNVQIKVVDGNNNPIQNARIVGLQGNPYTDSTGEVSAIATGATIDIQSPYIDLQDISNLDISNYVGSFNKLVVTLPIVGENYIKRFYSSTSISLSNMVKTVDVCVVGGGGGGTAPYYYPSGSGSYSGSNGKGGGGGNIQNLFGVAVSSGNYNLIVGSGAPVTQSQVTTQTRGGTSTAFGISAQGGFSSYWANIGGWGSVAGDGAVEAVGNGFGGSNTTLTEFNDRTTFYSGGGAPAGMKGGSPNGADGASFTSAPNYQATDATQAGIGGGGGGGGFIVNAYTSKIVIGYASAGGHGLVAIRFHF